LQVAKGENVTVVPQESPLQLDDTGLLAMARNQWLTSALKVLAFPRGGRQYLAERMP